MPTAILHWRLRSGDAYCDQELPVEVRLCPLQSRAGEKEEKKKQTPLIKSTITPATPTPCKLQRGPAQVQYSKLQRTRC